MIKLLIFAGILGVISAVLSGFLSYPPMLPGLVFGGALFVYLATALQLKLKSSIAQLIAVLLLSAAGYYVATTVAVMSIASSSTVLGLFALAGGAGAVTIALATKVMTPRFSFFKMAVVVVSGAVLGVLAAPFFFTYENGHLILFLIWQVGILFVIHTVVTWKGDYEY